MSDKLSLTLPDRKKPASLATKAALILLLCTVAVGVLNAMLLLRGKPGASASNADGAMPESARKDLALKLEKQGLEEQAAAAWKEYLAIAAVDNGERGNIWYRIGKLHQEAGDNARALDGYYRAESFGVDEDLASDIGRRSRECLEGLGKFAALRYELAERVGVDKDKADVGDDVVAEIGPRKITRSELDRRIEAEIDRQLEQYASFLPGEERKKQKEQMFKQLTSSEGVLDLLNQIVAEEVLYRKAREMALADDAGVRDLLKDMERKLLARKVIEHELGSKINITPGDVQTHYEAHKAEYVRPERARISHIVVATEEEAVAVLERLAAGEEFEAVAGEVSLDETTKDKGGAIEQWVEKGGPIPGLGASKEAVDAVFSTEAGNVAGKPIQSERGYHVVKVHEREPEYQRTFDEAKQEAYQALRRQKEADVSEGLMASLKDEYDVVIHHAKFVREEPGADSDVTVAPDGSLFVPAQKGNDGN